MIKILISDLDVTDDEVPRHFDTDPAKGVKLYFTAGDGPEDFEIVDRDACDGRGEIVIPTYDAWTACHTWRLMSIFGFLESPTNVWASMGMPKMKCRACGSGLGR